MIATIDEALEISLGHRYGAEGKAYFDLHFPGTVGPRDADEMIEANRRFMAATPGLRLRGVTYLLVYNALFVLPLVVMLGLAVAGVDFRKLSAFLERHLAASKLMLAAVFGALAAVMIVQRLA